ncbi:MAG: YggS family pyridoxal phosphate-dependent enzyme [Thermoguttaceae bacterium]
MNVSENLQNVSERITAAAERSGRAAESVRLVAVTKYATIKDKFVDSLIEAGCHDFGEARPLALQEKAEYYSSNSFYANNPSLSTAPALHWHLIGPLQRNKIRKVLPYCSLIHSVDSLRLMEAIDRIADEENFTQRIRVLLEMNISSESAKQGFTSDELPAAVEAAEKFKRLEICGLMGMSGLESDDAKKRLEFSSLRQMSESLANRFQFACPQNVSFSELSMGMSDDFEIAIEEGATIVRIGSILY